MNADQVAALRMLLQHTGWLERTDDFGQALAQRARQADRLLILGTPDAEPWHLTAHLDNESRLADLPQLAPTLVRWAPPTDAPAHLAVGLDRLQAATAAETLLVVSGGPAPAELLDRVHDVRRAGTTIFALDAADPDLDELAHESLAVPPGTAPMSFDAAQHLVSAATGLPPRGRYRAASGTRDLRTRLARLLDTVSGTQPESPGWE